MADTKALTKKAKIAEADKLIKDAEALSAKIGKCKDPRLSNRPMKDMLLKFSGRLKEYKETLNNQE